MEPFPHFNRYRFMAVDPGSNKAGVSIFDIDFKQRKIISIQTWTVDMEKLKNDTPLLPEIHPQKMIKLYRLRNEFSRILKEFKPDFVAYEGPFINTRNPNAFGPLIQVLTMIFDAVVTENPGVHFHIMQPQSVKKSLGVAGKKGKEVILEAIMKVEELTDGLKNGETEIESLDDNALDSVAVGWCALKTHIFKEILL